MATYTYPSSAEMIAIEQEKLPRLVEDDPIFKLFPIESEDYHLVRWEQLDNYTGLQQVRGINGMPARVKKTGLRQYQMQPGVYGEFEEIDEAELTIRRQIGTFGTPINISDLVMMAQDKLLQRRLDRIRFILWTLLTTGTFSVSSTAPGGVMHTDSYTLQTQTGSDWSDLPNATPLADFRATRLLERGKGVSFGAGAQAFMNRVTGNRLLNNQNDDDLHGRRQNGLSTVNNLGEVNGLLTGDDLPEVVIWDDGYFTDAGVFTPFIANDIVVVVGKRLSGTPLGSYKMTRNAQNPELGPGPYTLVVDSQDREVPRKIQVHDGHNGGPCIHFGGGVVILSV